MIILETILNAYTWAVLTPSEWVETITGIYPAQQLAYVKDIHGLPDSAGVMDTLMAVATP